MHYQSVEVNCNTDYVEILIAELAALGFTTFQESDNGLGFAAFTDENVEVDRAVLESLFDKYKTASALNYQVSQIKKENWNADWEKNYEPIVVENKILVRAHFHQPQPNMLFDIIVTPKMSFGTGHHETTHQLLAMLLPIEIDGKEVLDAGCGTGILGILAMKKGAKTVEAYDIDEWAVENSKENFSLNKIEEADYSIWQGDVLSVPDKRYDIIIANINRNILMEDIQYLHKKLKPAGLLLLSGFYEKDVKDISLEAGKYELHLTGKRIKNDWAAVCFKQH